MLSNRHQPPRDRIDRERHLLQRHSAEDRLRVIRAEYYLRVLLLSVDTYPGAADIHLQLSAVCELKARLPVGHNAEAPKQRTRKDSIRCNRVHQSVDGLEPLSRAIAHFYGNAECAH